MKNKIPLIFGPTSVGKTDISIELAKTAGCEIISADSMQVYRQMDIGTAKPTKEQLSQFPHHLIDVAEPDEEWTVSRFMEESAVLIKDIQKRERLPLITGGTGLYLNAFINGFFLPIAGRDDLIRRSLETLDTQDLYARLVRIDPEAAAKISGNDRKRIIRALEVYKLTGTPISKLQKRSPEPRNDLILFCLDLGREKLYQRINERVDRMIEKGLIDEVSGLLKKGYSRGLNSMQALGYKEVAGYLNNEYSKNEMIELIKKRTRNFARRQMVWFRRFKGVNWIHVGEKDCLGKIIAALTNSPCLS